MKKLLTIFLLLSGIATSNFMNAQSAKLWHSIQSNELQTKNMRNWIPNQYRALTLDKNAMQQFLANAPMESSVAVNQSPLILELPMPYGGFQKFHVVESPIMAPQLAAKYPSIKTYLGQGIDDPTAVLRCDVTVWGFHAFVLSASGNAFISPYSKESDAEYIAYYKHDLPTDPNPQSCLFDSEKSDNSLEETKRTVQVSPNNQPQNPAAVMRNNGDKLRTYRLALACTEEYSSKFPSAAAATKATVLAAMVTSVNRVNTVYEVDFAVRLVLVPNNDTLIFLPTTPIGGSDPYTDASGSAMLSQNQTTVNARIGSANYDMGHVFSTGGGGIAGLGVICSNNSKARGVTGSPTPYGDGYDIDYVAHEMGHQFGGNHTFNSTTGSCSGNRSSSAAYEPGSGTTIMAYAGICSANDLQPHSDPYFHAKSLDEIWTYINSSTGNNCPVKTTLTNQMPVLTIVNSATYNIPFKTPFRLKATATDADGDNLTYCWEQYNLGTAGNWSTPSGNAPIFRSFNPETTGVRSFPKMSNVLNNNITIGELKPSYARTMLFRCAVRDNHAGGGAVSFNDALATVNAINTVDSFAVLNYNTTGVTILGGSQDLITWSIAQSDIAPINYQNVNILYSSDNGVTFQTLVSNTPNDGFEPVTFPNIATTNGRIMVEAADNIFFDVNNKKFTVTFNANLAVENSLDAGSVVIYPNPSTGVFQIETILETQGQVKISVTNMLGQVIKTDAFYNSDKYALDLTTQAAGVYFVQVQTQNGSLVRKIVKE